jgi:hypothetical protein
VPILLCYPTFPIFLTVPTLPPFSTFPSFSGIFWFGLVWSCIVLSGQVLGNVCWTANDRGSLEIPAYNNQPTKQPTNQPPGYGVIQISFVGLGGPVKSEVWQ